jgi:hypothetical protein
MKMTETLILEKQVDLAQGELQKLLDEQSSMTAVMRQAAQGEVIDATALIEHQDRADDLPKFLFAARVKLLRSRIALLEACLVNQDEECNAAIEETEKKWQKFKAAEAVWEKSRNQRDGHLSEQRMTRHDLGSLRRELQDLIALNSRSHAPVVRSIPHSRVA